MRKSGCSKLGILETFEVSGDLEGLSCQRRPQVVGLQRRHAERPPPDGKVAMPGGQIGPEDGEQVVEHLDRDVLLEQRSRQRRGVTPGAHWKTFCLMEVARLLASVFLWAT